MLLATAADTRTQQFFSTTRARKRKTTSDGPLLWLERGAIRLFVLLGLGTLDLCGTGEGLHAVLALLACDGV